MDRTHAPVTFDHTVYDGHGIPRWYVYSDGTMLRPIAGGSQMSTEGGQGQGGQGQQGGDSGGQGGASGGGQGDGGSGNGDGGQGGSGGNGGQGQGSGAQGGGNAAGSGDGQGQGQQGQGGQQGDGQGGDAGDADDTPTHTQREVDTIAQMERRRGFRKHVKDKYGLTAEDAERLLREHASGGTAARQGGGSNGGQGNGSGQPTNNNGNGNGAGAQGGGATTPPPAGINNPVWVASAERALLRAGFPADADDSSMRRAVKLLEVDDDADDAAEFTQAAAALKKDMPTLFEKKQGQAGGGSGNGGQGNGRTPSSTPGGTAPRPQPPADAKQRGADRAKRDNARRGVKVPTS